MQVWVLVVAATILLALGLEFPRYTAQDDSDRHSKFLEIRTSLENSTLEIPTFLSGQDGEVRTNGKEGKKGLTVMTLNTRMIGDNDGPDDKFTTRLPRIVHLFNSWEPHIIGCQEMYDKQVDLFKNALPDGYEFLANQAMIDGGTAIVYQSKRLVLKEHDYIYSPKTLARLRLHFKDEDAISLNIARFRVKDENGKEGEEEVIAFNTHLDRWSEAARREQSAAIAAAIKTWKERYPKAVIVVTGDFNSLPGQAAHTNLTQEGAVKDSWSECRRNDNQICSTNNVAASYHAYLGSLTNTYVFRIIQTIAFTFHGMGVSPPVGKVTLMDVIHEFLFNSHPILYAIPAHPFTRLHVDWILFSGNTESNIYPLFHSVVDVRSSDYSSDHFPVVALFAISNK